MSTEEPLRTAVSVAVERLRARSARLRKTASVAVLLIVVALAAGLGLFFYAGEITNRESQSINKEFAALGVRLSELAREVNRAGSDVPRLDTSSTITPSDETFAFEKLTTALNDVRTDLQNARQQVFNPTDGSDRYRLISTVSTRIGSVLILIFLVQILVGLYRYNIRLAAFYDARADALEALATASAALDVRKLRILTLLWSPDQIGFGKEPRSPLDAAIDLTKEMLPGSKD